MSASGKSFVFEIVTPEKLVLREEAEFVSLFTVEGSLGIFPGHAPLIARLCPCPLYYISRKEKDWVAVMGGFLKAGPDRVIIISDMAERAREIDIMKAQKAKEMAEALLTQQAEKHEMAKLAGEIQRALVRLKTVRQAGMI